MKRKKERLAFRGGRTIFQPAEKLLAVAAMAVVVLVLFASPVWSEGTQVAPATLQGEIKTSGPVGQVFNMPGVGLKLTGPLPATTGLQLISDEEGKYKFVALQPGSYTLETELQGFKKITQTIAVQAGESVTADLILELEVVRQEISVQSETEGVETKEAAPAPGFQQTTLQTVPLVNEKFTDALPLIPGVVRGPDGLLNVKGARASETGLTVNSANVTDPVTGQYALSLPIEAIQSVKVITNPYAPEYGKFTGAVTSIETREGGEKWRFQIQDFFPRLRRRGGKTVGLESVTPRVFFSGPLVKNKLRFLQSFEYNFIRTQIENLPPFQSDTQLESFDSFTQFDWDINPSNHLTTTFSVFPQKLGFVGLNTFNPQTVTPNYKQRGFFWAISERKIFNSSSLLESFFSFKQFDANIFPSTGMGVMNLAPNVNSGSFFNRQDRDTRRYEWLEVYHFAPKHLSGSHLMKVGGGLSRDTFDGRNQSNPVRVLRANGSVSQEIDFTGSSLLHRNKTEILAYYEDKWEATKRLTLEYGARYDHDNVADDHNLAPRVAFAFLPILDGKTVIRGGVGLFYDKINLNVATSEQLHQRVLTRFAANGTQVVGQPQVQRLVLGQRGFRNPRSVNWNVEFDREWWKNFFIRVGYQQREGRHEYLLNPVDDPVQGSRVVLGNGGNSRYREFQVTARYVVHRGDELTVSYVRSSATGDLNDFNSYFGNFENPIVRPNERSRLPWDAPSRFLLWGTFRVRYGIIVVPVFDIRDGFPLSTIDEDRNFVGPRNRAGRFPTFASLDLQVLKTVPLPGPMKKYKARVGLKFFNITNHFNPRDFQGNLASAQFDKFSNSVSRKFRAKFVVEF